MANDVGNKLLNAVTAFLNENAGAPEEAVLLEYFSGRLNIAERESVAALISSSPELQEIERRVVAAQAAANEVYANGESRKDLERRVAFARLGGSQTIKELLAENSLPAWAIRTLNLSLTEADSSEPNSADPVPDARDFQSRINSLIASVEAMMDNIRPQSIGLVTRGAASDSDDIEEVLTNIEDALSLRSRGLSLDEVRSEVKSMQETIDLQERAINEILNLLKALRGEI